MSERNGFLSGLGQRIRTLRRAAGWSLQELAARSEISPRFLSELEAGRGNISVARLEQMARALEQPVQALIPVAKDDLSLRGRVWDLIETSPAGELEKLYGWLSARRRETIPRSIALVGVRGAGKSTVGRLLADRLRISFIEFDTLIEREAGISLMELFALHGESYYRKLQREVMEQFLAKSPRAVLATGGSLVADQETWSMVRRHCHTVWLKARPRDHWSRVVAQGDIRPMKNNPTAMDELRALLRQREPLYAEAEVVIDTSRHSVEESVEMIVKPLRESSGGKKTAGGERAASGDSGPPSGTRRRGRARPPSARK